MAGKSILVVDTPNSCKSCKYYDEFWCKIEDHCPEDDMGENGRVIWCPLRPLPQKGTMEKVDECEYNRGFVDGRNHCIELITGETE